MCGFNGLRVQPTMATSVGIKYISHLLVAYKEKENPSVDSPVAYPVHSQLGDYIFDLIFLDIFAKTIKCLL